MSLTLIFLFISLDLLEIYLKKIISYMAKSAQKYNNLHVYYNH